MAESEPPSSRGGKEFVLVLITGLAAGVLFLALSFVTFGLPLVVLAVAGCLWMYVGIMRLIDHLLLKAAARRQARR